VAQNRTPGFELVVSAGPHERRHTALSVEIPEALVGEFASAGGAALTSASTKRALACQVDGADPGRLWFIVPAMQRGKRMRLTARPSAPARKGGVRLTKTNDRVRISVGGAPFTAYHYAGDALARQYLYPILGHGGARLTRECRFEDGPGFDHKHHKSIWVAHGLVNGADNWAEEPGHAETRHVRFEEVSGGAVLGRIVEDNEWRNAAGQKLLGEHRVIRVYNQPASARCVDFEITFRAGHDSVLFGDTKEGGLLSVRVNPSMDAPKGTITNSFGGINEEEAWGKRAHWCDYSGKADGRLVGIAVFDHPKNPMHPTHWHVRNYGLMTANPFGLSYFDPESGARGDWLLPASGEATFRYRLFIHRGSAEAADLSDRYSDYVSPPIVDIG